jgi:signal transduction histidine kinase
MPPCASPGTDLLAALADYICSFREKITAEWTIAVRGDAQIPTADNLPLHQLVDHLPALFDDLANRLRRANISGPEPRAAKDARIHGRHRWQQGYNITEVLREVAVVRRMILLSVVPAFADQHPDFSSDVRAAAKRIIHEFFENMILSSVAQYVADQQTEMRRVNAELEAANRQLHAANESLEQVDDSRLLLTRNVSHEIRNMTNAMSGAVQILADDPAGPLHKDMIEVCQRSLADMEQLLHQLLDYSTVLARGEELDVQSYSLHELCDEIAGRFKPLAQQQGVAFDVKCAGDAQIRSDYRKLMQIAANLILNAIKYRKPETGSRVEFSCTPADAEHWKMSVGDNGIGMSADDLNVIFKEFQRGSGSANVQGAGLGLTITKGLVELLGGKIEVSSVLGEGSRFEITFPRQLK